MFRKKKTMRSILLTELIIGLFVFIAVSPIMGVSSAENREDEFDYDLDGIPNTIDLDDDNDGLNDDEEGQTIWLNWFVYHTPQGETTSDFSNEIEIPQTENYRVVVHAYGDGGGVLPNEFQVTFGGDVNPRIVTQLADGWNYYYLNENTLLEYYIESSWGPTSTLTVAGAIFDEVLVQIYLSGGLNPADADMDNDGLYDWIAVDGDYEMFGESSNTWYQYRYKEAEDYGEGTYDDIENYITDGYVHLKYQECNSLYLDFLSLPEQYLRKDFEK